MSENQERPGTSRREFLGKAAVAGTVASTLGVMPTTAEAMRRVRGANERINCAVVGVGVQGFNAHCRLIKEHSGDNNTELMALCDIYTRARNYAGKEMGVKEGNLYDDHRKLLQNKDVDVVFVATADNWHADITMDALNAGKHVYCEKPMCKTVEETFKVLDTVKKTGKKFQIGAQRLSEGRWYNARKAVADGMIGKVIMGQASYMRNGKGGEWNGYRKIDPDASPTATGEGYVNWEVFRKGSGPKDWDPDRFFRWRKYWAYGSGLVGDLFPHRLYPLFVALNIPTAGYAGWPTRVSSGGGIYVQKMHPEFPGKIDREVPDFTNIQIDFGAEECTIMAISSTINEVEWPEMIRGNKATLYPGVNGIEIKPERIWADEIEGSVEPVTGAGEDIAIHQKNLFECIRNGKETNGNIEVAARMQVAIALGEQAYRQSKTFTFDPKTRTYKG